MATQVTTTPSGANEVASALRASSLPRLMSQFALNVGILLMKERDLAATSSDDPNYPLLEEFGRSLGEHGLRCGGCTA